jgi:hypothetical protein
MEANKLSTQFEHKLKRTRWRTMDKKGWMLRRQGGDLKIEEEHEPSNDGHKDYWKGSKEQYLKG